VVLLVVLRRDLLLGLEVQGVALCCASVNAIKASSASRISAAARAPQSVEHAEVERANEPKVRTWHLVFSSLDAGDRGRQSGQPSVELVPTT
jgi:hypothetical protein